MLQSPIRTFKNFFILGMMGLAWSGQSDLHPAQIIADDHGDQSRWQREIVSFASGALCAVCRQAFS
jgi:hypothetical protein